MDVTAVYGAALATVLAVVRIVEWAQNRPRVVVKPLLSFFPSDASGSRRAAMAFRAHNYGMRPTTLEAFFYAVPRKKAGGISGVIESQIPGSSIRQDIPALPARLDPGGIVTVYWSLDNFNQSEIPWPYALVGFRDALGRVHYCVGGLRGWWLRWRARHWGR